MADHDNSYKLLFSHPQMIRDLLLGFVNERWVAELEFSTLQKVSGSFVTDNLRGREDDIIWRVRWRGQWLFIYILLEFQSTVDHFMGLRVLVYQGLLWQDLIRSKQVTAETGLPVVIPVVLYRGDDRWTAPQNVEDLVAGAPEGMGLEEYHRGSGTCCWTRTGTAKRSWRPFATW